MVRENHPNKCPHICLYLIVKQQTCRSGRSLAGGVTPAKAAHYTYRLMPCKPFLKKSFGAQSGSRNGIETAARGGDLNNSPSRSQDNESGIFAQERRSAGTTCCHEKSSLQRARSCARRTRHKSNPAKMRPYINASPTSERASQKRCSHANTVAG